MNAIFTLFFLALAAANSRTIYSDQAYGASDNQKLYEVADMLKAQPDTPEKKQGLTHLLHATMHMNMPPSYVENGVMVNELHPPVKVVAQRHTKARRVPHRDAQVSRRIPAGSVLVALATTPDMLWVQVGKNEFMPTKDAQLEEPLRRESPTVSRLEPPLRIHVKGDATVRKIPDIGGKPVARVRAGDLLTAVGVTPDYAWLMLAPNQFLPTAVAKMGDPSTPLLPPLTVHLKRDSMVREAPAPRGKPGAVLHAGDIVQAVAVSADLLWLKLAHNSYVKTADCKLGLPPPPVVDFPRPLVIQLVADAQVVKNPNHPEAILRWLKKGDELQAFGATADMQWIAVAEKRFIPMAAAKMKSAIEKPIALNPPVGVKLSRAAEVRDLPDERGRVVQVVRAGDKYEATAVSADFAWLKIGGGMWIPMTAAFFRKPSPVVNPLIPPMKVTVLSDAKLRKTPDHYGKVVKTIAEGDTLTATAVTPDLAWLKVGEKLFLAADGVKLEDQTLTAPLFPHLTAVVTRDVVVRKSPAKDALPIRRLKRGEVLTIHETTTDMKWLKLAENQFIPTEYAAHVSHSSPLTPPVKVVVAADVRVRNVPAFAGMPVKNLTKGEMVVAVEVTPDWRWLKIAKDQFVPASACVLHDSEGKDMRVVLKIRNANIEKDPVVAQKAEKKPDQAITTSQAASLFKEAFDKRIEPTEEPATPVVALERNLSQLRVKEDTLVMARPAADATPVRGLKKGSLVDASGLGTNLVWLKIGEDEFIKIAATEPTDVTTETV